MSQIELFGALETLPSVGRRKAEVLRKLGLQRISDVIFNFPRDYEDYSEIKDIGDLEQDETASILGEVEDFEVAEFRGGRSAFYLLIGQDGHYARAVWFNQPYRAKQVAKGRRVMLEGKVKLKGLRPEMVHPNLTVLDENDPPAKGRLLPVYRLTEGIKQFEIRSLVKEITEAHLEQVEEIFPQDFLARKSLLGIQHALQKVHFPVVKEDIEQARKRLVFQELLTLQLAVLLRKKSVQNLKSAPKLANSSLIDSRIKKYFAYELTAAQQKSIDEISQDLSRDIPMNRMLHGDVGCGKTSVAVYALLLAVANGCQGVFMAPTEILARQHFKNIQTALSATQVNVVLMTGGMGRKAKQELLLKIEQGHANIIVGTQALLQNDIHFDKLGLVIVDEQHRFGVKQRADLRQKGVTPHYLVMTATPIPRTVAMTLFGELDVSVINEKPPNRPPVHTYLCGAEQKEKWWDFVRQKLKQGRQAYVIAPLVNPDDESDWESVEANYEHLANGELAEFRVDLVHGRQKPDEKELAMDRFADGETQVLVATSVVEVGINVPNATVMTILSASRFGLSQLHQLRGRVSRGNHAGYVALFNDSDLPKTNERLQAMVELQDGFQLAEVDFEMRGPGDLFGTRQHGMPPLFVADLQRDQELLADARQEAEKILEDDPELNSPNFAEIKNRVIARYGKTLDLGDVG